MPSLFQRSNGVFYIAYSVDGKRRWKSTGKRQRNLAINVLLKFDKLTAQPAKRVLLSEFAEDFLASATTNFSSGTIGIYRQTLASFVSIIGDLHLSAVTPKHIDIYKTERLKTLSPVTMNIELRTLRAAFYTAVRWKHLAENPFKNVPLIRIPEQQPTYLTKAEFRQLLSVISEQWFKDLITVAVYTGLRRAELLNMLWKDVDFQRNLIYIQSSADFKTKHGKRRSVPMNQDVVTILMKRFSNAAGEFVFSNRGKRIQETSLTHKFKASILKAELNEELHFHSLRHTFATWLVQEGVSIYEVQKLLGHSSVKITEVYSHLASGELHESVARIRIPALN